MTCGKDTPEWCTAVRLVTEICKTHKRTHIITYVHCFAVHAQNKMGYIAWISQKFVVVDCTQLNIASHSLDVF